MSDYYRKAYPGGYVRRVSPRRIEFYLREVLSLKPSGSLFEVGCAYGLFLEEAAKYYDVSGCDISGHAVAMACRRTPAAKVLKAGIEDLQIHGPFDVIACFDVLEHVENPAFALRKIRSILKDDGIIAVSVPVYDTPAGWLVRMLDRDDTHIWKQGREHWRSLLKACGFRLLRDLGLWRWTIFRKYNIFFGGRCWKNFSPAIMLVGQRDDIYTAAGI
jgi:2-polyprenyl-3-methyl-5-hydroxy-6-metoxy-1,4-benzoquinol methylase